MAILNLVETSFDGWPIVEYNGKQGKAPAVLLEPYKEQQFMTPKLGGRKLETGETK